MESGCQTGSQMDSVGIGEVRQCDDEWRTEFTVRGMKCAFLAAKYVTAVTATKRQKDEADQKEISSELPKCSRPKQSPMKREAQTSLYRSTECTGFVNATLLVFWLPLAN